MTEEQNGCKHSTVWLWTSMVFSVQTGKCQSQKILKAMKALKLAHNILSTHIDSNNSLVNFGLNIWLGCLLGASLWRFLWSWLTGRVPRARPRTLLRNNIVLQTSKHLGIPHKELRSVAGEWDFSNTPLSMLPSLWARKWKYEVVITILPQGLGDLTSLDCDRSWRFSPNQGKF